MKGIILAGGSGTRLHPITRAVSKQLMPIFDKPMIYYPLSTLIEGGIREILIITTPHDKDAFVRLLGDGSQLGCSFEYIVQSEPNGLAEAFILGETFIGQDNAALILGDNIFNSSAITKAIQNNKDINGGLVFAASVSDPERYGVVEFDKKRKVLSIEEKPTKPKSNYAIPGLYIVDNNAPRYAKQVKPSERGELEIIDIHNKYLEKGKLIVQIMEKSAAWLDTGTFDSMVSASEYVRVIEERHSQKIGCIEEAAFRSGFINKDELKSLAKPLVKSGYGKYLLSLDK